MYLTPETIAAFEKKQWEYAKKLGEPLPEPRWEAEKKQLIERNQDDEFYFLVNLKTLQITWHHNLYKVLGYEKEQVFSESFFDELAHPFILHYYNAFALGMYDVIFEKKDKLSYMNMRYKITLPFRKENGDYICVQQISYPCEFDVKGQVVTHITRHIDTGIYIGQPLQPAILLDTVLQSDLMMQLHQNVANLMSIGDQKAMFTRDELKVLNEAYKIRHEKTTYSRNDLLQNKFKFSIKHANTSIKQKAQTMFLTPLNNIPKPTPLSNFDTCLPKLDDVYQIAEFLYHSHIMPVMDIKLRSV